MIKILVLTYNFKPDTSPTAHCLELMLEGLSEKFDITVVTSQAERKSNSDCEVAGNLRIIRFFDLLAYTNNVIRNNYSRSKKISKLMWLFFKLVNSALNRIYYVFYPDGGYFWKRRVLRSLNQHLDIENYSIVLASTGLFSTQTLADNLKTLNPNLKIVAYLNDPLPINNPFIINSRHLYDERCLSESCINNSDVVLANSLIFDKYASQLFADNKDKFHDVDIPLLKELPKSVENFSFKGNPNSLKILYAGSLYKDIRNPESPLLSLLSNDIQDLTIHILGNLNDCGDIIDNISLKYPNKVYTYGNIERQVLYSAIKKSDYLFNIGNDLENQVPSKIFEYMSAGKPIIHFYNQEYDTSLRYLRNYKHVYLYNIKGNVIEQKKELQAFLGNNFGKTISFSSIKKCLYKNTPDYVSNQVQNILLELEVNDY